MPLNANLEGKSYPAIPFVVDEDRVAAFARAVGDGPGEVPPTFATVAEFVALAQMIGDPELGLDFSRVVHGEQEFEWRRALRVGDALSAVPRITSIRAKGGHEFLEVETELRDSGGDPVVVARMTVISRGTA